MSNDTALMFSNERIRKVINIVGRWNEPTSDEWSIINKTVTECSDGMIKRVREYVFYGCTALTTVDLPAATSMDSNAFYGCTALTTVNLPAATSIGDYAFNGCTALTTVDLPAATSIGDGAFNGCTALTTVILRSSTVCVIFENTFLWSTIESGTGYIYVPRALVDSYKVDTTWSTYAAQIRAIEDYPDICGG